MPLNYKSLIKGSYFPPGDKSISHRILILAENQKDKFARVFGYSVFSIIFFHFFVNISMTLGLFPVVGIPLPFVSYGGSSLLSFSLLIFIFLKLNSFKPSLLSR